MARSKCYSRCHMTLEQYGLYQYACEVSYASEKFYLSGPKAAMEFAETGKNTIYRVGRELVDAGWFKMLTPRYRDHLTGLWRPMVVKPLTHKEWKQSYPDAVCPAPPPERQATAEAGETMTDSGHGTMTESGKGTMTDFESSMTVLEGIHDRIREQVLEVSSEVSESVGTEQDSRAQMNTFQAAKECEGDQKNQDQTPIPRRLIKEPEGSACRPRSQMVTPSASPDPLSRLATCLYDIGREAGAKQAFSGANLSKLGSMLRESSEHEIVEAWREHLEGCSDDFLLKQAVNSFCKGSGRTIIDSQRKRANEEQERQQAEENATREFRLQSSIGRHAEREMLRQEQCVRDEYSTWLDHHDEGEDFTPSNEAAFERYWARQEYKSASFADQWPLERRVKELERAAIKGLMADPTIIDACEAEFAKAA